MGCRTTSTMWNRWVALTDVLNPIDVISCEACCKSEADQLVLLRLLEADLCCLA